MNTFYVTKSDSLTVSFGPGAVTGLVEVAEGGTACTVDKNGVKAPLVAVVPNTGYDASSPTYDALYQVTKTNHERNVINRLYNRYIEDES